MRLDMDSLCVPDALRPFAQVHLAGPAPLRAIAEMISLGGPAAALPKGDLARCALALRRADPEDRMLWQLTSVVLSEGLPDWHWRMVNDLPRNQAYQQAIDTHVAPGMTVLEIGTGSGLLAMMAARAGAAHVYTIEMNANMVPIARRCIAANGFADRITVIEGDSRRVEIGGALPRRCDLLVHEILSTNVLNEGVLPAIAHARETLLVPGAPLLPERAWAMGALSDADAGREAVQGPISGFDLSALNDLLPADRSIPARPLDQMLSDPVELAGFDMRTVSPDAKGTARTVLAARRDGTATGIEQWLRLAFPGGQRFEALNKGSSWGRRHFAFARPLAVTAGQPVAIRTDWVPKRLAVSLERS